MTITTNSNVNVLQPFGIEYKKKFCKQMVKGTLFIGVFQEKRFVDELNSYRDVITICPEEEDFIGNLKIVKRKLKEHSLKTWVGITDPETIGAPVGYNLWVDLPEEVFGKYWYKVKTVEFLEHEVRLKLDIVRPYQRESTPLRKSIENETFSTVIEEKKLQIKENVVYFLKNFVTLSNLRDIVIFLSVLFTAILTGAIKIIEYLLEYFLKLLRELSGIIKVSTPIFINVTNLIGKTIFGLFYLIYALWKGKPKPGPVYNNFINLDPQNQRFVDPRARYNQYFNKQLIYPNRGGPTITPLYS